MSSSGVPLSHCAFIWKERVSGCWQIKTYRILQLNALKNAINTSNTIQQQRPFNGLWSGTTRVGRYQKKHSPTHTHPDHRASFITFRHLQRSMASSTIFPTVALPFFKLKYLLHGFPGLFTVISWHICFLLLVFSVFTLFSCRFRAVD